MTLEEILEDIRSGLSGEREKDIEYLSEQLRKYDKSEYAEQIGQECGKLMFELLPEEKRPSYMEVMEEDSQTWKEKLRRINKCRREGKNEQALEEIETLIREVEAFQKDGKFVDDAEEEYRCFASAFEFLLYVVLFQPKKDVHRLEAIPYADIYLCYGSLLIDFERFRDAQTALVHAMEWNPVNCAIQFEYLELLKMMGDYDAFFQRTLVALKMAYTRSDVARCFRNLGYYFSEHKQWSEALSCLDLSIIFEDNRFARAEIAYIQEQTNNSVQHLEPEAFEEVAKKYGFCVGADDDIIGIAYHYGKQFKEEGNQEEANYYLGIAYRLTESEEIKQMMEETGQ